MIGHTAHAHPSSQTELHDDAKSRTGAEQGRAQPVPLQKSAGRAKAEPRTETLVPRASRISTCSDAVARSAPVPAGSAGKKMTGALTSIAPVRAVHKAEGRKDACAARRRLALSPRGLQWRSVFLLANGRAAAARGTAAHGAPTTPCTSRKHGAMSERHAHLPSASRMIQIQTFVGGRLYSTRRKERGQLPQCHKNFSQFLQCH